MEFLCGCAPESIQSSPTATSNAATMTQSPTRTPSPTAIKTKIKPSPSISPAASLTRSPIILPLTIAPPLRLTPTRGLPPTATISPKENCPPATHAAADIQFFENPGDYGSQILEYIRANGNAVGLQTRLEQLGIHGKKLVDYQTRETVDYFFNDIVQLFSGDVTGDLSKETVISLLQYEGNDIFGWPAVYSMVVFIVGCHNNQFQFLYQAGGDVSPIMGDPKWSGIMAVRDLNADGIREIVYSAGTDEGAHADVFVGSMVLEWNGDHIRSLLCRLDKDCGTNSEVSSLDAPLELKDIDGNGTMDLLFPDNGFAVYCDLGPWRIRKDIYMWDGKYYRFMWTDPGVPKYRFQAAFDGDYYAAIGLYDKSESLYLRSINDFTLKAFSYNDSSYCSNPGPSDPNEPQWIKAYARFRLLELFVSLRRMTEAENEWYYLAHNFQPTTPGYPFALLANTFWEAYQTDNNIDDACMAVKNASVQYAQDGFGLMNYGYLNPGPKPGTLCPFTAKGDG